MGGTKEDRMLRQQERIIAAAGRCFAKNGFKGATIDDIAAAASLSRPILYKHFDAKEALIDAVLDTTFDEWLATNSGPIADEDDRCLPQLRRKIRESVRFAAERPALRTILRQDPRVLVAAHAESFRRCHDESLRTTVSILRAGQERGEIRPDLDPETAGQGVEMVLFALVERAMRIRPDYPFSEAMLEESLDFLTEGLRSHPEQT